MNIKELFAKRRLSGLFILLLGVYTAWVQIDCYYNQSLAPNQQKVMAISTLYFILGGTFYLMPKMDSFKEFFTKNIISGLITILVGVYLSSISIDGYYEQTLTIEQIRSIGIISFGTILMGYYYIMKNPISEGV